jgi:molybdopterin-guanine dinucleotide biosynthesis protein A
MILPNDNASPLNGLVLAGGMSTRMGRNKALMKWHDKEQQYYLADMLMNLCEDVFISCRKEQEKDLNSTYKSLPDTFFDVGPLGGILSAFQLEPGRAWLVVACDLPLVNEETLQFIITNRNITNIATAYKNPSDGLPEPLITIWEPESYPVLLTSLENKVTSPRAVLMNSAITMLQVPYPEALLNANTPEDAAAINKMLDERRKNNQPTQLLHERNQRP